MSKRSTVSIVTLVLVAIIPVGLFAQIGTVAGRVVDASTGDPLLGANVIVVGTNFGAATDINGEYSISTIPGGTQRLTANYIGYASITKTVEVTVAGVSELNFDMSVAALNLKEVVVTGTGIAAEKASLGNSIVTINMDALADAPITTFQDILQGREGGVVMSPNSGLQGEGSSIRIRGSSTLTQSNEPVVYVDGIRVDNAGGFAGGSISFGDVGGAPSKLNDINPEAIERIEILKGSAAATLYGTQAANGIVQIFTKQGAIGKPRFTLEVDQSMISHIEERWKSNTGFARNTATADTMSKVFGISVKPFQLVERTFVGDVFAVGQGRTYTGSVTGGSPGATYYASLRYQNVDGAFDESAKLGGKPLGDANDQNQQFQASATLNLLPTDKLRLRLGTHYTYTNHNTIENNNNIYGTTSLIQFGKPEWVTSSNQTGAIAFATARETTQQTTNDETDNTTVSLTANYKVGEELSLDATVGLNLTNSRAQNYTPFGWAVDGKVTADPKGFIELGKRTHKEYTFDVKGSWSTALSGNLSSDLVVGFQAFRTLAKGSGGDGELFPGPGLEVLNATADPDAYSWFSEVIEAGLLAQERIGLSDYLFVTLGVRQDANSAFGTEFNTVTYPRFGLSFIPSNMLGAMGPLSTLRLRAAWGKSGLQPGAFDQFTTFTPWTSEEGSGLAPESVGNPDLKPEITTETEVGAEFGLLSDKIGVEFGYWSRNTEDGLVAQQFPPSGGFYRRQLTNIGEWEGSGWDLGIKVHAVEAARVSIEFFGTLSYLQEEVVSLGGAPEQKLGGSYPRYRNFLTEGYAPGALFGAKIDESTEYPIDIDGDGEADSKAELLAFFGEQDLMSLLSGWGPVLAIPSDADVSAKRAKDADDPLAWYLGKSVPDYTGSFGFTIKFLQKLRRTAMVASKWGNFSVTNLTDAFRKSHPVIGRNTPTAAETERDFMTGGVDASGNPKYDADVRLEAAKKWVTSQLALAPYSGLNTIEDGTFVRWRELSLTYNFPREVAGRLGVETASITVAGRNIALWTDYTGIDPELNVYTRTNGGIDDFAQHVDAFGVPVPRTYTLSFRVGF